MIVLKEGRRIREEKKITAKEAWDLVASKVTAAPEIDVCFMSGTGTAQWISTGTFDINNVSGKIAKFGSSKSKSFQALFSVVDIKEGVLYEWSGGKRKTTIKLYLKDKTILSIDC